MASAHVKCQFIADTLVIPLSPSDPIAISKPLLCRNSGPATTQVYDLTFPESQSAHLKIGLIHHLYKPRGLNVNMKVLLRV